MRWLSRCVLTQNELAIMYDGALGAHLDQELEDIDSDMKAAIQRSQQLFAKKKLERAETML